MKKTISIKLIILYLLCIIILAGCSKQKDEDVSIEIWHYYNGAQKIAFDEMIMDFNETVGFEKGIIVEAFSQGNIDDLKVTILDSVNKKVGAKETPNVVTAYPDTARRIDEEGFIVDLEDYMADKEIKKYIDSYIEEGYLGRDNRLKIFPIAKATEIMMVNKTDWDKFAKATGAKIKDLETWEGLAKVAESYYNWTDSLTEATDDGKAFFGRDAMANYIIVGAKQLGQEIFEVTDGEIVLKVDDEIMRQLWDNYYIPYINGYYASFGRFSSDDAKIGEIIAFVGSTTGAAYFPDNVTIGDDDSYDIKSLMLPLPNFENTKPYAIQQGAGMIVLKSDEIHERASVEFLKWFTKAQRNIEFSMVTGYLPVTKEASDIEFFEKQLEKYGDKVSQQLHMALGVAMEQMEEYELHIGKAFENGAEGREFLTTVLIDKAKMDRGEVIKLINEGKTREEAVMQISTDANFEQWLLGFKRDLEEVIK